MHDYIHMITDKLDHPSAGGFLLLAGILPTIFSNSFLSAVYFALLIPPAGYHCYQWFKVSVLPTIQKYFKRNSQ